MRIAALTFRTILLGLAISLISISLAYQRFVIRPEAEENS